MYLLALCFQDNNTYDDGIQTAKTFKRSTKHPVPKHASLAVLPRQAELTAIAIDAHCSTMSYFPTFNSAQFRSQITTPLISGYTNKLLCVRSLLCCCHVLFFAVNELTATCRGDTHSATVDFNEVGNRKQVVILH